MKLYAYLFTTIALCLPLHAQNDQTTATKSGYLDVTEEINPYDQQFAEQEKEIQQAVFGSFASIVQNLFCIMQNPKNPTNVATNVAAMVASIVSTGMTVTRNVANELTIEERQQFIDELMVALERELRCSL